VSEEQLQRFEPNTVHMCTCQTHITTFDEIQHGGGRHCEEIMFETVEGIKSKFCRKKIKWQLLMFSNIENFEVRNFSNP